MLPSYLHTLLDVASEDKRNICVFIYRNIQYIHARWIPVQEDMHIICLSTFNVHNITCTFIIMSFTLERTVVLTASICSSFMYCM